MMHILGVVLGAAMAWAGPTAWGATLDLPGVSLQTSQSLSIVARLSDRELVVRRAGTVMASYPIAVGTRRHPTPTGNFMIAKLVWNPRWVPPDSDWAQGKSEQPPGAAANPMQTVKLFFREPTYYIHGTNDPNSIGTAASHGCIRMTPEDAADLARLVMRHGGQPRSESWFRRILRFRSQEEVVYLDNPVPLTIRR